VILRKMRVKNIETISKYILGLIEKDLNVI
jgi:hypothetical protein